MCGPCSSCVLVWLSPSGGMVRATVRYGMACGVTRYVISHVGWYNDTVWWIYYMENRGMLYGMMVRLPPFMKLQICLSGCLSVRIPYILAFILLRSI